MVNRNDLTNYVKQFDLVVKQEIQNYQKSLNAVFDSIRELKEDLQFSKSESLENYSAIHTQHNDLVVRFSSLEFSHKNLTEKLNSHIGDFEKFIKSILDKISCQSNVSTRFAFFIDDQEEKINELNSKLQLMQKAFLDQSSDLSQSFKQIQNKMTKDFGRMKEEIISTPSQSTIMFQQVKDDLSCHKVDVEGIMKEIRINRKEMVYLEKKIEHLFTLLERLKMSGGKA